MALLPPADLQATMLEDTSEELVVLSYPLPRVASLHLLSDAEAAVALLALAGYSNADIAAIRAAAERTVANQLGSAYRKLGGASRASIRLHGKVQGADACARGATPWLEMIEAVYRSELCSDVWLRRVGESARPLLDCGLGVVAWIARDVGHGSVLERTANVGMPTPVFEELVGRAQEMPIALRAFQVPGVSSLREALRQHDAMPLVAPRVLEAHGAHDFAALVARHGARVLLVGFLVHANDRPSAAAEAICGRLAGHLAAGLRLRQLEIANGFISDFRARQHHAAQASDEAQRRERLRRAAITPPVSAERESAFLVNASRAWHALTQGDLRLADYFDSNGRRVLITRKSSPEDKQRTPTARQVEILAHRAAGLSLKEIAAELDLSTATVGTDLGRALRALGLRSVNELLRHETEYAMGNTS